MGSLNPDYGTLTLTPMDPRIWLGGPSRNCWRMYWNPVTAQWELDGGNGLVRYTTSSTWTPNNPNVFDVLLFDKTLQAPASITVYPLSPLPCTCPGELEPPAGVLTLVPYAPAIGSHLAPAEGLVSLTSFSPRLNSAIPHTSVNCTDAGEFVVPSGSGLGFGGPISISMWLKPTASAAGITLNQQDPVSGARNFQAGVNLGLGGAVRAIMRVDPNISTAYGVIGATDNPTGTWFHYVGIYDGTNVYVYVNGSLDGTLAAPLSRGFADNLTNIGGWTTFGFQGHMVDVRLFNAALSGADVTAIYNAGHPSYSDASVSLSSFYSWWKCNEGSGTVLHDSKGGRSATASGTIGWVADSP